MHSLLTYQWTCCLYTGKLWRGTGLFPDTPVIVGRTTFSPCPTSSGELFSFLFGLDTLFCSLYFFRHAVFHLNSSPASFLIDLPQVDLMNFSVEYRVVREDPGFNNVREIRFYFNIWGIRKKKKKKKKRGLRKRWVKIHPFHLPWIRTWVEYVRPQSGRASDEVPIGRLVLLKGFLCELCTKNEEWRDL